MKGASAVTPLYLWVFLFGVGVFLLAFRKRRKKAPKEPAPLELKLGELRELLKVAGHCVEEEGIAAKQPFTLAHRLLGVLRLLDECLFALVDDLLPQEVAGLRKLPEREGRYEQELKITTYHYRSREGSVRLMTLLPRRTERLDDALPDLSHFGDGKMPSSIQEHKVGDFIGQLQIFPDTYASLSFNVTRRCALIVTSSGPSAVDLINKFCSYLPLGSLRELLQEPHEEFLVQQPSVESGGGAELGENIVDTQKREAAVEHPVSSPSVAA